MMSRLTSDRAKNSSNRTPPCSSATKYSFKLSCFSLARLNRIETCSTEMIGCLSIAAPLHIQDKLVLVLFEHKDPDRHAGRRAEEADRDHGQIQPLAPEHAAPESRDVPVHRVDVDQL